MSGASESSSNSGRSGDVNSYVNIIASHWWDDVFEAADLEKFVKHSIPFLDNAHEGASSSKFQGGKGDIISDVLSVSDLSSTSSGSLAQQYSSDPKRACSADASRFLYPSRLKILAAKIALNSGKQYLSSSGQVRRARHLKKSCHSNCKRCHHPKLTATERQVILDKFWSLKNHEKQWMFICNQVSVSSPKRKFSVQGSKGEKSCSREYFLTVNGRKRKVCKTMFKHTLCICDSWIDSALSHVPIGLPDLRGRSKTK
ncbi:D-alanine--D-alanine ligase [Frankliniella fusca]|uniref:D-alanine--D-alanine ligase n=1 Tax=Frankliniella fusca TaxID=407009 RepID=A0AAE1H9S5_9NEOP|nr:D-alanine--D-alanine ligase [Frankliniella fusca]